MSGPIKAGDSAVIVGACCDDHATDICKPVEIVAVLKSTLLCRACGHIFADTTFAIVRNTSGEGVKPVSWLRRIDPPAKQQGVRRVDEVKA